MRSEGSRRPESSGFSSAAPPALLGYQAPAPSVVERREFPRGLVDVRTFPTG